MSQLSGMFSRVLKWIAFITIVLLSLPELLRVGLIYIVSWKGVGEASIEDVDLNLFSGTLAIEQFDLTLNGNEALSIGDVNVNVGWVRLLFGEINIQKLEIERVRLSVVQTEQGMWEVIVPIPEPKESAQDNPSGDTPLELPKLVVQQFLIRDVSIVVKSKAAQGVLNIDDLKLVARFY